MSEPARNLWTRLDDSIVAAREHMQTHTNSAWLDRVDAGVSDIVGLLFAWARIALAGACLMWTFFLFVLPLLLATVIVVGIASITAPRMAP